MATPVEKLMETAHLTNWDDSKLESVIKSASELSQNPLLASTEQEAMARVEHEMREQARLEAERARKKEPKKKTRDRITLDLDS